MPLLFPAPATPVLAVLGQDKRFPVHRIYCVGQNYARHAQEMGSSGREPPFFFMKPADAIVAVTPGDVGNVAYPPMTSDLHHEVELVVAIDKGGSNIPVTEAPQHVLGYAVGIDLTRRDLQAEMKKAGRAWSIAKGFDQSAPIGPIVPAAQAGDVEHARIALSVNGQPRQEGSSEELIWKIAEIIAAVSNAWELQPGDLIFTGTPAGVGALQKGDEVLASVAGLPDLHIKII